jgi:hypothetical protein
VVWRDEKKRPMDVRDREICLQAVNRERWRSAKLIWDGRAKDIDIAILEVEDVEFLADSATLSSIGPPADLLETLVPPGSTEVVSRGYPEFFAKSDPDRPTTYFDPHAVGVNGRTHESDGSGFLQLTLDQIPSDGKKWRGISGAPVFRGSRIL